MYFTARVSVAISAVAIGCTLVAVACTLNPQPLPPESVSPGATPKLPDGDGAADGVTMGGGGSNPNKAPDASAADSGRSPGGLDAGPTADGGSDAGEDASPGPDASDASDGGG